MLTQTDLTNENKLRYPAIYAENSNEMLTQA